jgi:hypothetical protein
MPGNAEAATTLRAAQGSIPNAAHRFMRVRWGMHGSFMLPFGKQCWGLQRYSPFTLVHRHLLLKEVSARHIPLA